MGLTRQTAVRELGRIVRAEITSAKRKGVYEEHIAERAGIEAEVIRHVVDGNDEQYRENEVRKLLNVLLQHAKQKKRAQAFFFLFIVHPTKRSMRSIPYKNRKHFIAGKNQFSPSIFSFR